MTGDEPGKAAGVTVRGLTKTFGAADLAVHAVKDVDLDVSAGEQVLIMGPSGSGKTTPLLMVGAMLRPTSGQVMVAGVDLAAAPERQLPSLGRNTWASSSRTSTS